MSEQNLHLETDKLESFLSKVSGILDQPIEADKIQQALAAIDQLDQGDEQDLQFELLFQAEKVPLLIKAGIKHFEEAILEVSSPSNALIESLKPLL